MNRKKKQEPNKSAGDRFESIDDVDDREMPWDEDAPEDPAERPHRNGKGKGRDKGPRSGPRKRSFDDDSDG